MPRKRQILSQGALEYLITYGWALVMIATIIGVLVITTIGVNKDVCPNFMTPSLANLPGNLCRRRQACPHTAQCIRAKNFIKPFHRHLLWGKMRLCGSLQKRGKI